MNITGRIENWQITRSIGGNLVIVGDLYDDVRHRFADGERVHTSTIMSVHGDTVWTKNSIYKLGKELDTQDKQS